MNKLLDRLKQVDPTTYKRAFDWLQNVVWELIKDNPEGYFLEDGPYPLRDALLQACLQEAICGKEGWTWQIQNYLDFHIAYVVGNGIEKKAQAKSPSEAILRAYIAACEAMS